MNTLQQRADQIRNEARSRLLELLPDKPVYFFYRYQSRTWSAEQKQGTAIVDFFVIRLNRPVSISKDIALILCPGYLVDEGKFSPGIMICKQTPGEILARLSLELYGREGYMEGKAL